MRSSGPSRCRRQRSVTVVEFTAVQDRYLRRFSPTLFRSWFRARAPRGVEGRIAGLAADEITTTFAGRHVTGVRLRSRGLLSAGAVRYAAAVWSFNRSADVTRVEPRHLPCSEGTSQNQFVSSTVPPTRQTASPVHAGITKIRCQPLSRRPAQGTAPSSIVKRSPRTRRSRNFQSGRRHRIHRRGWSRACLSSPTTSGQPSQSA